MLKGLFGKKKEENASLNSEEKTSKVRFSTDLKSKIESSTLKLMTHDLFMHYWSENLIENKSNPEWKNQAIFFFRYKEPFEKQSLPPHFRELQQKTFIVNGLPESVSVSSGQVMPWFGMPGGGTKYFFQFNDKEIQIKELINKGSLSYVEIVKLSDSNSNILTDRENYFFLMDTSMIQFVKGKFFNNNMEISFSDAVEIGGLEVIKIKK
ncbi:MAG: glycohydrolase toxin TNT-related protein [Bacteroidales bacterium]|nr:glycohydrolase toxin TNT-related protein [Bacteroidales bacterium]